MTERTRSDERMQRSREVPDFSALTPRELGAMVTPLFIIDSRFQQEALNELVIRCEVAARLRTGTTERTPE